jgi:hypothetical protein
MRTIYAAALLRWKVRWLYRLLGVYGPGEPRADRRRFCRVDRSRRRALARLAASRRPRCRDLADRIEMAAEAQAFRSWFAFDQKGGS